MPRVLLVFEPPDGGVATNVTDLATGMSRHGWDVEVVGPGEATIYGQLHEAGISVHRLPIGRGYSRPWHEARALFALIGILRRGRFDVVHCHASKAGVVGRLSALFTRTPSLYSPHCFAFATELARAWRIAALWIERVLGHIGHVLCVCHDEKDVALRARVSSAERLHVVHNGCTPCPADVPEAPALTQLRDGGLIVGSVSRLQTQKRLDVLIDAAPSILARVPHARVAIVGDGPLKGQLQAQASSLGLDDDPRFAFVPFEPPSARALKGLDVYVLSSTWEAFPIGVLEAQACGVPQVATDVGGTHEAVTADTGVLVPAHDSAALADGVVTLLEDPARCAAAAEASRARHAALFELDRMVADTVNVYEAISQSRRPAANELEVTSA